jgi:L-alanine-DL-glutamate epimerase-like enolase superfamily enzyme
MKISRIQTLVVKAPVHDRFGGQTSSPLTFPGTDYYFESEWREVYSRKSEALLVRIDTEEGLHGWGESQAPIMPEVAKIIIDRLLAPLLIGCDPRQTNVLWDRMYNAMRARGHTTSFMLDAISGIDIALWDIKGKAAGESVASMLGGPFTSALPGYISGLRAPTDEGRAELAARYFGEGYVAIKLYLGRGIEEDLAHARAVRQKVGNGKRIMSDLFWNYTLPEAERLGRALQELGVEWIESPLAPEDIRAHSKLADALQVSIAVGEPLRTRYQFLEWFERRALDIAQPDVARCGLTEGKRISDLASAWHIPVAFHLGVSLGVAIAATWQLAAAVPNFYILELEPPMLELSNHFLTEQLRIESGQAVLPKGPGLGIDVNMDALREWTIE